MLSSAADFAKQNDMPLRGPTGSLVWAWMAQIEAPDRSKVPNDLTRGEPELRSAPSRPAT
jgi:hypothetical protein